MIKIKNSIIKTLISKNILTKKGPQYSINPNTSEWITTPIQTQTKEIIDKIIQDKPENKSTEFKYITDKDL